MTNRVVEFLPHAEHDAKAAREWYADRSLIAARAFLSELIQSVERIAEGAERYPAYLAQTRRCAFPKFPFSLIRRISAEGNLVVIAVAHHRRKPGYWTARR